jgi:hypothetical protein
MTGVLVDSEVGVIALEWATVLLDVAETTNVLS